MENCEADTSPNSVLRWSIIINFQDVAPAARLLMACQICRLLLKLVQSTFWSFILLRLRLPNCQCSCLAPCCLRIVHFRIKTPLGVLRQAGHSQDEKWTHQAGSRVQRCHKFLQVKTILPIEPFKQYVEARWYAEKTVPRHLVEFAMPAWRSQWIPAGTRHHCLCPGLHRWSSVRARPRGSGKDSSSLSWKLWGP